MAQPIDEAFVEVRPDVDNFARTLKRQLDRAFAGLRRDVDSALADVDSSFRRASTRIGGHGRRGGTAFALEFASAVGRVLGGLGRLLAGTGKLSVGLAGIAGAVGVVSAALAGLASAAAAAIPVIASLAASLVTAAGAAAAIPGAIAVVVAAVNVLKLGMVGLKDAMKAVAEGDAENLREALEKLAPNARAFVKEVARLKPAFDRLRLGVQNRLFADTAQTLRTLAASTLPTVTTGFNRLADVINRAVVRGVTALNTQANQRTLAAFFASAAATVATLGAVLRPVGQALLDLVGVGAQVTAQLSGGVAAAISDFARRISELAASGGLKQIIADGLAALGQFASLAGDVLGIVRGIVSAAGGGKAGGGIFAFFDRLNQLVNRPDVQKAISSVFASLAEVGVALTPVLVALLNALVPVAKAIGEIAVAFGPTLVVVFTDLGGALAQLAPAFIALAPALVALSASLAPIATILTDLVVGIAPGVQAFLAGLFAGLVALAPAARPVGEALAAVLTAVAPLLPALGESLAQILIVLAPLFVEWAAALVPLIPDLVRLLGAVTTVTTALLGNRVAIEAVRGSLDLLKIMVGIAIFWLDLIESAVNAASGGFKRAGTVVSGFGSATRDAIGAALGVIRALPGQILGALGNFGNLLVGAGRALIDGLIRGIRSTIGELKDTLGAVTALIPKVKGPEDADRRLLQPAGQALMEGLGAGITVGARDIRRQLQDLTSGIGVTVHTGAAGGPPVTAPSPTQVFSEDRLARAIARALNGMEWRFLDVDRVVSRSIGYRANLARRGG